jgi:thiol:disulfide interchange protein DsbD
MKAIISITVVFIVLSCLLIAPAQDSVVSVRAIAPVEPLKAGTPASIAVELNISSPYHINSDHPLEDYLIPTTLELEPQPEMVFGKAVFPAAQVKKLPVSDSPMAVFEGIVRIAIEVTPVSNLTPRDIVIRGRIRYQACNDNTCLPPVRQPFSLKVSVENPAQLPAISKVNPESARIAETPQATIPPAAQSLSPASGTIAGTGADLGPVDLGNRNLALTFFLVFLGGLALNLTPCVYPMIPITITYFGGQAQGKRGGLVTHSLLYVIGMAVTYSVLGVVAAMTGSLFGSALQYPAVLIGIASIMVLLALSMFDVYEFRMPASFNRFAAGSQKGFGGTFLMGLTVGIIAAPCVGPFVLGLLTYVGNRGSVVLGFALFFVLALGLGVPFLVLGIFSGSIRRLPRSGAWMVWVRKIFGFVLLVMAVYFLKTILPSLLVYYLTLSLVMLLAGIYLAWIDPVQSTGKVFPCVRNAVGVVFFAVALYTAVNGLQAGIGEARDFSSDTNPNVAVQWLPYSEVQLDRASRESKPILIDFYADWCAPCKELDMHTFSAPEIIDLSKEFIMLKVDLTSSSDPHAESLRKKYRTRGVPTLVFLKPDGRELSDLRVTGFEPKERMLERMDRVLRLSKDIRENPG